MNFLRKLFSQSKTESVEVSEPVAEPQLVEAPSEKPALIKESPLPPGLHVGKLTNVGQVRERNEDSMYTIESVVQYDYGQELFGLLIVADGMGGHEKGDVASSVAARTTANYVLKDLYLPCLASSNTAPSPPINDVLVSAVERANNVVLEAAPEGGTTLTAALIMGNNAYIAHVGDTRAYFIDKDCIKQITQDHSLAQRLKDIGQATPEQVTQVEHVLYRAIGQGGTIEVDTYMQHLPPGTSMLLCSDGLWKGVDNDETLKEIINSSATPQEACEKLVALANKNGGEDNITGVIAFMGPEG
jgi:serine/threonine protein phosphatase PrpC